VFYPNTNSGLMYSTIDMSLDNGNGAVLNTEKNIPLITYNTAILNPFRFSGRREIPY